MPLKGMNENVPFASWVGELVVNASGDAKRKRNFIDCQYYRLDPKPSELTKVKPSRAEPVNVAKLSDELWLGVKGQSNSEIAGFPAKPISVGPRTNVCWQVWQSN